MGRVGVRGPWGNETYRLIFFDTSSNRILELRHGTCGYFPEYTRNEAGITHVEILSENFYFFFDDPLPSSPPYALSSFVWYVVRDQGGKVLWERSAEENYNRSVKNIEMHYAGSRVISAEEEIFLARLWVHRVGSIDEESAKKLIEEGVFLENELSWKPYSGVLERFVGLGFQFLLNPKYTTFIEVVSRKPELKFLFGEIIESLIQCDNCNNFVSTDIHRDILEELQNRWITFTDGV